MPHIGNIKTVTLQSAALTVNQQISAEKRLKQPIPGQALHKHDVYINDKTKNAEINRFVINNLLKNDKGNNSKM